MANSDCLFVPPDGGGASVLGHPTVNDNCTAKAEIAVTNDAPEAFELGVTIVTWTATDACGNSRKCTQIVTVVDETRPSLVVPADLVRGTNDGCTFVPTDGGGASQLGDPTFGDNCTPNSKMKVFNDAPAAFPLGTTVVRWIAEDASGNRRTRFQQVIVVDDDAPVITCPGDMARAPNQGDTFVPEDGGGGSVLLAPMVTDNCSGEEDIVVTSDAPDFFPLGSTEVTWTVTDAAGNAATCTQLVTVVDTAAPNIDCPMALSVEPNVGCAWVGDFGTPVVTDPDSDDALIVVTNNAPGAFPAGLTVVTWTATDPAGNASSCQQEVTVTDVSAPTLICPALLVLPCTTAAGVVVEFEIAASDNCGDENVTVTSAPASGSVFPTGTTNVTATGIDAAGNSATCTFDVVVTCEELVLPGDCNLDNSVDVSDAVCLLNTIFLGLSQFPCGDTMATHPANVALMSWNGEGSIDLSSAIGLLMWKFLGGPPHVLGTSCALIPDCPTTCEVGA